MRLLAARGKQAHPSPHMQRRRADGIARADRRARMGVPAHEPEVSTLEGAQVLTRVRALWLICADTCTLTVLGNQQHGSCKVLLPTDLSPPRTFTRNTPAHTCPTRTSPSKRREDG